MIMIKREVALQDRVGLVRERMQSATYRLLTVHKAEARRNHHDRYYEEIGFRATRLRQNKNHQQ
jgi:hypothetical protein